MRKTVTIVSANRETLDELKQYLDRAGMTARAVARMDMRSLELPHRSVLILFPDEFAIADARVEIAYVREKHPDVVSLIVTRHPLGFTSFAADESVAILPKPAWGWTILEAIHALTQ